MEEINLEELLKFFIARIKYVLITMGVFIVIGLIYVLFVLTPLYHSSTTLILVSNNDNQNSTVIQSELNLNKNLVKTYSEIVKSRSVLNKVIDKLKLSVSADELSKDINVTSVENTEIIRIQVSNENNKMAKNIASATSEVFISEIKKIYKLTNVSVVDEASLESSPYNVNYIKQLFISAVLGIFGSMGVIFLIFYFDTTIKSSKDIEEKLGLAVLGNITVANKEKGDK